MPRKSLVVDIGGSGTTSAGAAAQGSGDGAAAGAGKRTFVCANGTRYVMPFYIYYNQSGFKVSGSSLSKSPEPPLENFTALRLTPLSMASFFSP